MDDQENNMVLDWYHRDNPFEREYKDPDAPDPLAGAEDNAYAVYCGVEI